MTFVSGPEFFPRPRFPPREGPLSVPGVDIWGAEPPAGPGARECHGTGPGAVGGHLPRLPRRGRPDVPLPGRARHEDIYEGHGLLASSGIWGFVVRCWTVDDGVDRRWMLCGVFVFWSGYVEGVVMYFTL